MDITELTVHELQEKIKNKELNIKSSLDILSSELLILNIYSFQQNLILFNLFDTVIIKFSF